MGFGLSPSCNCCCTCNTSTCSSSSQTITVAVPAANDLGTCDPGDCADPQGTYILSCFSSVSGCEWRNENAYTQFCAAINQGIQVVRFRFEETGPTDWQLQVGNVATGTLITASNSTISPSASAPHDCTRTFTITTTSALGYNGINCEFPNSSVFTIN